MARHPAKFLLCLLFLCLVLGIGCTTDSGPAIDAALDVVVGPADDGGTNADDGGAGDVASDRSVDAAVCGPSPWVLMGAVRNARQLGTVPLANSGTIACNQIYRGAALSSLSAAGCGQYASLGIKTVIDLRDPSERVAPTSCVSEQSRIVLAPLPIPYNVSPADYRAVLYAAPSMRIIFATLADAHAYPVYYHCVYGKDRSGVVTAIVLSALGATREAIQAEYALTGEAGYGFYPQSLDAVLDEIDRVGGIDAYFKSIGVPKEQVDAMRTILVRPALFP
jgi:protein-tyrosine phosphatase